MSNLSFWAGSTEKVRSYPSLSGEINTDVAIIGAGITGITAALQLIERGKKALVIDAYSVGESTTGYSTGNLYVPVQPYFYYIKTKFDRYVAKIVAAARARAIDFIEITTKEREIECSFQRRPLYLFTSTEEKESVINMEAVALRETDIVQVEDVREVPFPVPVKRAIKINDQARINPLKYVRELAASLERDGLQIFENTPARDVIEHRDHCTVHAGNGKITAKKVIMATHIPKGINLIQTLTAPYRSYVIGARLKNNEYMNANIWDISEAHQTISTHSSSGPNPDILFVAGLHHKTGQGEQSDHTHYFSLLEEYTRQHFEVENFEYHWSAQHYHSGDGIPYIGLASRTSDNVYMATGFYADGLVYGTVAGIILGDLIVGKQNPWISTFNSNRFTPLQSAEEFFKENANVFTQYLKLLPGMADARTLAEIAPGDGKVIEHNGHKIAVYKDNANRIHSFSAVCPHMKCIVRFNNAETTWDCPCHGSRFSTDGKVIEGPAYMGLTEKRLY